MSVDSNLVDLLVALGVSGVVGTTVNFVFNRRGLRADAANKIAEAAATMTGTMEKRIKDLEQEAEERRRADREREHLDLAHEIWDRQIYAAVKRLDPESPILPPPPLRPPGAYAGADN